VQQVMMNAQANEMANKIAEAHQPKE